MESTSLDDDSEMSIQGLLDLYPAPEYVSTRPGPAGLKMSYISAWRYIAIANDIFGYDGWSYQIIDMTVDYLDQEEKTGRFSCGVCAHVKVTAGTSLREDVGYGTAMNMRSKGEALEVARKQASTDALKRALRLLGNVFGAVHDESFCKDVNNMSKKRTFIKRQFYTPDIGIKWRKKSLGKFSRDSKALVDHSSKGSSSSLCKTIRNQSHTKKLPSTSRESGIKNDCLYMAHKETNNPVSMDRTKDLVSPPAAMSPNDAPIGEIMTQDLDDFDLSSFPTTNRPLQDVDCNMEKHDVKPDIKSERDLEGNADQICDADFSYTTSKMNETADVDFDDLKFDVMNEDEFFSDGINPVIDSR